MTDARNGGFRVSLSESVANELRRLRDLAGTRGQGAAFTSTWRRIIRALRRDLFSVGDALYHLGHLRLQVRSVMHAPLVVHFAVSQDRLTVYIKSAALLSTPQPGD